MTYVVGIKRLGTAAIITDSLLTSAAHPPRIDSIKSGVLFPGCIFGICGNWGRAWECLLSLRARCTENTLEARFEELARLVYFYNFPRGDHNAFEILLSSRHAGTPEFYLLSSSTERMHPVRGDFIALGSGRQLLDAMFVGYSQSFGSEENLQKTRRQGTEAGHSVFDEDFAHLYAFLLFQSTQGDTGQQLASLRAGGFVHFVFQDGQGERRQKPRLYVLGRCDDHGNLTSVAIQRLAFDEDPVFGDLIVIAEPVGQPPKPQWGVVVQNMTGPPQSIVDSIVSRQKAAPLYEILIAGRIDHERKGAETDDYPILVDRWSGTPVLDLEGHVHPTLLAFLKQHT